MWRYRDLHQAFLAKGTLESAGIECALADTEMVRMNWTISNAVGGVRLLVAEPDVESALAILSQPIPRTIEYEGSGGTYEQPQCPSCGSLNMRPEVFDKFVTYGSLIIAGLPVPVGNNFWGCEDCGHRWEPELAKEDPETLLYRRRVLVATTNKGKLKELTRMAGETTLEFDPIPHLDEVEETGNTFAANARLKAEHYSRKALGELVIADDSGLEVPALGGAPGVFSARYAAALGRKPSDSDNNYKLIYELGRLPNADRSARFVCVIAAAKDGATLATFEGEVRGEILQMPVGRNGFGYDPLFYYAPLNKTFAELTSEEKASVSHRGMAFEKFLQWMSESR